MRKRFFENRTVKIFTFIICAALLIPIAADCVCFFMDESLQWNISTEPWETFSENAQSEDASGTQAGNAQPEDASGTQEGNTQAEDVSGTQEGNAQPEDASETQAENAQPEDASGTQTETDRQDEGVPAYDADDETAAPGQKYSLAGSIFDKIAVDRIIEAAGELSVEGSLSEPSETGKSEPESADGESVRGTEYNGENGNEAEPDYYIKINRAANCVTIYIQDENGEYTVPYKAIVCSTGKYNRTPLGTFTLSTRYRWRKMVGGVYSQYATRVHGSILIHSVPYYTQKNSTLETNQYNKLGEQASLGCIRMSVEDAKWVFDHCEEGTVVEIYEDAEDPGPLGKPVAIKIDTSSPDKGWDPTDPDEDNPWK